jgi:hypothetical protein
MKGPGPFPGPAGQPPNLQDSYTTALPVLNKDTALIHRLSAAYNQNTTGAPPYKVRVCPELS